MYEPMSVTGFPLWNRSSPPLAKRVVATSGIYGVHKLCFDPGACLPLHQDVGHVRPGAQAARKGRALGQAAAVRPYSDRDRAREASSASKAAPPESGYVAAIWPGGRPGPAFTV